MNKYIFLDVDGVLNSEAWLLNTRDEYAINDYDDIDDNCLAMLASIVDRNPGTRIVLSSSWRHDIEFEDGEAKSEDVSTKILLDKLDKLGLKLYDKTPTFFSKFARLGVKCKWTRDYEILSYVGSHLEDGDSFVIFDDENIDTHKVFNKRFIRTKFSTGLTREDADLACEILNIHWERE